MKGFFRSKLVLSLMAVVLLTGAIIGSLAVNAIHSYAQGAATASITPTQGQPGTLVLDTLNYPRHVFNELLPDEISFSPSPW